MSPKFKREYGKVSIKVPRNLRDKKIKEIRIIPKYNARYFEIQYSYEISESKLELNKNNVLAIDLGIDNLCTCTTNRGDTFIIVGKKNNQNFVNIPIGDIASKLEYLSKRNNNKRRCKW